MRSTVYTKTPTYDISRHWFNKLDQRFLKPWFGPDFRRSDTETVADDHYNNHTNNENAKQEQDQGDKQDPHDQILDNNEVDTQSQNPPILLNDISNANVVVSTHADVHANNPQTHKHIQIPAPHKNDEQLDVRLLLC
ncbi:hypothetical protein RFI_20059 [Reticulomyxa filosa]|uniref:Uncharacterized protein n=1 Tax=Reticulomyxa filosa TaxID=46433 RepID=X6MUC1_RETFI|nr:hypothetical protein RFI_20059 [Reticulomyxa filosa]|eukprot:ETO17271.1 hypothetical protein RFI_20059 [Reticulomyxa filosa]